MVEVEMGSCSRPLRNIQILGTGIGLPAQVIESTDIDRQQGHQIGYTEKKTGVYSRHYATSESATDLATLAIADALVAADISIDRVDCLIAASGTMEQAIPCNAAKIHARLGFSHPVPAFDINMTCLSALMAFDVASSMIQSGQYQTILIVSSDIASVGVDWSEEETGGLFGDGAAAIIMSGSKKVTSGFHTFLFETYSEGVDYCQIKGGGSLYHPSKITGDYRCFGQFEMKGKELYRLTAKVIDRFIEKALSECGLTLNDIDWVVPHQASQLALTHLQKRLGVDSNKVINMLRTRGNQIAASIPSALHELYCSNRTKPGDKILLIGTSAGLSLGIAVLEL